MPNDGHTNAVGMYIVHLVGDNARDLHELSEYAVDYAHFKGGAIMSKNFNNKFWIGHIARTKEHKDSKAVSTGPSLTLLPSPFPQELYDQATAVQQVGLELEIFCQFI
jgi:hypothetical protein